MIGIYIISGFLGAGKTTFIQKMLKEAFTADKVVLIENDFGEISVDAALLKSGGVEVTEINSGCICCSLSGDFVKALKDVIDRFHPDKILIEPSGVGKLSDIIKTCSDARILPLATIQRRITVADVKRCRMYLDNFGEFFEDQIAHADTVLLSRTAEYPERVSDAEALIRSLNDHAAILSMPWDRLEMGGLLSVSSPESAAGGCHHDHGSECTEDCCHEHEEEDGHEHPCEHEHHHAAEDVFDTVTIHTSRLYSEEDLKQRIERMEQAFAKNVLRAKGIVRTANGYINLQYLPGNLQLSNSPAEGGTLCIIGCDLDPQELKTIFDGE